MFSIRFVRTTLRFDLFRSFACLALGWLMFSVLTDTLIVMYNAQSAIHPFSTYDWIRFLGGPAMVVDDESAGMIRNLPIFGMVVISGLFYRSRFGHSLLMLNAGYEAASVGIGYRMYGESFRLGQWLTPAGEWAVLITLALVMTVPYWKWPSLPKRTAKPWREPKPEQQEPVLDLAPWRVPTAVAA